MKYLTAYAASNVWCNPTLDNPNIFEPARICSPKGVLGQIKHDLRSIELPTKTDTYYVYRIGQISPTLLGLIGSDNPWATEKWVCMSDAVNNKETLVMLYNAAGVCLALFQAYYMLTNEQALIIAVKANKKIPVDLESQPLFIRLYVNRYFKTLKSSLTDQNLRTNGRVVATINDTLAIQTEIDSYGTQGGFVFCYVNGLLVESISPFTVEIGDTIEYVFDASVKKTVEFDIDQLSTFVSEVDGLNKYILHYKDQELKQIDYVDEVDIFIRNYHTPAASQSAHLPHNSKKAYSMLTHRDYCVPATYVDYVGVELIPRSKAPNTTPDKLKLFMVVRRDALERPLVHEASRILELYKCDSQTVLEAMTGVHANVGFWKASELEKSPYVKMMSGSFNDITPVSIQEVFGYHAIAKVLADTPQKLKPNSGFWYADLPYGLRQSASVYEYDAEGLLQAKHTNSMSGAFASANTQARMIEALVGESSLSPDVYFGQNNIPLPTDVNYRVYMCFIDAGVVNNQWRDITGTDYYEIKDSKLVWTNKEYDQFLMVRTDRKHLFYEFNQVVSGESSFFHLVEKEDRGDGEKLYVMPVPGGELDVWLNGHSLIEGLDYVVDFPRVFLTSKRYLLQPAKTTDQKIAVRFTGFCDKDLNRTPSGDIGFVNNGLLSSNHRFDLRDDRIVRIVCDGRLKHRDDIIFAEDHSSLGIYNTLNGAPYQIKDVVVPLRELVDETTYSLREKALAKDKIVSDFMSVRFSQKDNPQTNVIPGRYTVVSVFFARLIDHLEKNILSDDKLPPQINDKNVKAAVKPYLEWLKSDPLVFETPLDERYVEFAPHYEDKRIGLSLIQYRFLQRVVSLYANQAFNLSGFVYIKS